MFKMLKYQLEYVWARLGEKGQGVVEYALILAAVVAIAAVALSDGQPIGEAIKNLFTSTGDKINDAAGTTGGGTGGGTSGSTGG